MPYSRSIEFFKMGPTVFYITPIQYLPMDRQPSQQLQNYVKVSQFRYPGENEKPELIYPTIPLSTVRQKIFSMGQIDFEIEKSSTLLNPEGDKLGAETHLANRKIKQQKEPRRQNRSLSFRKFIVPRDKVYRPELLIFERYNYENYTNYAYKNPFRPKAPNIISSQEKQRRKLPLTYQANLQTIYYRSKYDDFNKIVGQKLAESRSESVLRREKAASTSTQKKKKLKQPEKALEDELRRTGRVKVGSSSLANLIKQFTVLQKLTQMIETEMFNAKQPLSVNMFGTAQQTASEQIFVEVLVHRFGWFRKLNKRIAQRIFSALGVDNFDRYTKITLKIYVEFVRLFVVRDAPDPVLSEFLFKFFFSKKQIVTKEIFEETIDLLQGPESKHQKIMEVYRQFFADPVKHFGFRTFSQKNANIMNMIVDLIVLG